MISFKVIPAENPYKMETTRRTINGWILSRAEKKIIKMIERSNSNNKYIVKLFLITDKYFLKLLVALYALNGI